MIVNDKKKNEIREKNTHTIPAKAILNYSQKIIKVLKLVTVEKINEFSSKNGNYHGGKCCISSCQISPSIWGNVFEAMEAIHIIPTLEES